MVTFKWEYLELFANNDDLVKVTYLLSGNDGINTVSSQGLHEFQPGTVTKKIANIVEGDIWQWIEQDITKDGINPIKLTIENQLNTIENVKKVDLPWLANTFTIE